MSLTLPELRRAKNFTKQKMAEELKVHVNTYSKMESEPDSIKIKDAVIICRLLGTTIDELFPVDG